MMNRFFTLLFAASCLTAVGQVPDYVPTDGLVAWYNFDGNANDHSGNEQNASSSSVSYTEGPNGAPSSAAHFNGNAQIVVPHHDIWNSEEYTLSIGYTWQINPAAYPNGDSWFFSKREGSGWGSSFEHGPMGALSWSIGGNGWAIADFLPPQNEWIQMAWVFGSDSIKFYLDAELVHVVASPGPMNFNTLPISIGMRGNGWHGFIGDIDYIGYWSRQITAEEVVGLHNVVPPVAGCMEMNACNFNPDAAIDDGTCDLFTCKCLNGTVWDEELQGCISANTADINNDGCVQLNDLLDLLSAYGDCGSQESAWQCGDLLEYQGYDYETVQIGEQCWFAENLRAENYRNGDLISVEEENAAWVNLQHGGKCLHDNSITSHGNPGYLYNGLALLDERGLCPSGWNTSTDADWRLLEQEHGLSEEEALAEGNARGASIGLSEKMRDLSWGTDLLGFGVDIGGYRQWQNGAFSVVNSGAFWAIDGNDLFYRELYEGWEGIARATISLQEGLSVRCIQDSE